MRILRLIPNRLFVVLMAIWVIQPASAREKTDVVWLKNGDRITCEIKYLMRGMLTVSTDSMSTVEIKWQDVESITSEFLFTVQDIQGQLYVGSLQAAAAARHVNVAGPLPASGLEHLSVVQIREFEDSMWKRLSGSADLCCSFSHAIFRRSPGYPLNISRSL
jgi:hypothetical protein